jgi:hypothetical protein
LKKQKRELKLLKIKPSDFLLSFQHMPTRTCVAEAYQIVVSAFLIISCSGVSHPKLAELYLLRYFCLSHQTRIAFTTNEEINGQT